MSCRRCGPFTDSDVVRRTRRARYLAGQIGDHQVPAYVDEEGVNPRRSTETFAEMELGLENWRWPGTIFRLRTGKPHPGPDRHRGSRAHPRPAGADRPDRSARTTCLRPAPGAGCRGGITAIAHTLISSVAFIGYTLLAGHVSWLP